MSSFAVGGGSAFASRTQFPSAQSFAVTAGLINGGITNAVGNLGKQAKASTDTFEEAVRPYIGIEKVSLQPDGANKTRYNTEAVIKNFGTIPAYNFVLRWRIVRDGQEIPSFYVPDKPSVLNPGGEAFLDGSGDVREYQKVLMDRKTLDLYITWEYSWRNHREKGCAKEELTNGGYISLGPICGKYISK